MRQVTAPPGMPQTMPPKEARQLLGIRAGFPIPVLHAIRQVPYEEWRVGKATLPMLFKPRKFSKPQNRGRSRSGLGSSKLEVVS